MSEEPVETHSSHASTIEGTTSARVAALGPRAALVIYERGGARVVEVRPGAPLVLGRRVPADVVIQDPSVSRQHARLEWREDALHVEDLGSRNGTVTADGRDAPFDLRSGDIVRFGGITASVHVVGHGGDTLRGIDPYDTLLAALDAELTRARHFRRTFAVLVLRAEHGTRNAHVSRWCPRVREELSEIDRMATFGSEAAVVLSPETDAERALEIGNRLVAPRPDEPRLYCGIALYPLSGGSAGGVLDAAQDASRKGTQDAPVHLGTGASFEGRGAGSIVVTSPGTRTLRELVRRFAPLPAPVLVLGETGTGKELVSRALHQLGARPQGPLHVVNCAAIPEGLTESVLFGHERGAFTGATASSKGYFEQADGGTLVLDEVGELSPHAQASLLRVLETKVLRRVGGQRDVAVDVRVVAATHRDLEARVASGDFRADLLFRLNTLTLYVPPLRERPEEVEPLSRQFLKEANLAWGGTVADISPAALALLEAYAWPGNVRELRNTIERAVAICQDTAIVPADLPERLRAGVTALEPPRGSELPPPGETLDNRSMRKRLQDYETQLIVDALEQCAGNQSRAAALLGMPLRSLVHKLGVYGIRKRYGRD